MQTDKAPYKEPDYRRPCAICGKLVTRVDGQLVPVAPNHKSPRTGLRCLGSRMPCRKVPR